MFDDPMTADDWERFGFEEVDEIVPQRIYEVWGPGLQAYRIYITRQILGGSNVVWNSSIDERVEMGTDELGESHQVWVKAKDVPARHLGENEHAALRDAAHWLSERWRH